MRYRTIDVRMWGDQKFRSLTPLKPSGQALFIYILTNPNTTSIPGLYRAGAAAMAEELGWSIEDFKEALEELIQQNLIKVDLNARVIYIPNAIKYNKPQSPNVIKSWVSHWDEIPECELKNIAYLEFKISIQGMGEGFQETFHKALGEALEEGFPIVLAKPSSKAMPNQEQEQEQEQKQEINTNQITDSLSLVSTSKNTIVDKIVSSSKSSKTTEAEIKEIFEYWKLTLNHPKAKLDQDRKRKIIAARKLGFSIEQLKQAIDGCSKSSWHIGQNDQKKRYDGISLIFKNAEKIEQFIGLSTNTNTSENEIDDLIRQIDQTAAGAI